MISDPASGVEAMNSLGDSIRSSADEVDNAEVKTAVGDAADAFDEMAGLYGTAIADPANADQAAVQAASQSAQDKMQAVAELCNWS